MPFDFANMTTYQKNISEAIYLAKNSKGEEECYLSDDVTYRISELIGHAEEHESIEIMRIANIMKAFASMPKECTELGILSASHIQALTVGYIGNYWMVTGSSKNGGSNARLQMLMLPSVWILVRTFNEPISLLRFIQQTQSNKNNSAKRDLIASIDHFNLQDARRRFELNDEKCQALQALRRYWISNTNAVYTPYQLEYI